MRQEIPQDTIHLPYFLGSEILKKKFHPIPLRSISYVRT